ncbi:hypothetical protein ACROYT_G038722 [Oculina patagonica]
MSTLNEPDVYERVLYLGKGKRKWEQRKVSVKRNGCNGKSVVKVLPTQRRHILWRQKKPETVELTPNSHAVIHMNTLGDQRNVIGILPLRRSPQMRGHYFTSESREVLDNLKAILSNCCDVISFEVDFEETPESSTSSKAQLHIFRDRICLSTNLEYEFKLFGEWPIDSLSWMQTEHGGVALIMTNETQEETLLLRTERGNDICSKLTERYRCLAPAGGHHEQFQYSNSAAGVPQRCDSNFNIMPTSRISKSCELMHRLHFNEPMRSKSKTFPLTKAKPSVGSRQSSSLSRLPFYLQAKSPLSSDESISKKEYNHQFSDSCSSSSTEQCSNSDNNVNSQKQLELTAHKVCTVANRTIDGDELCAKENQNNGEPLPPPIPQRQLQRNSAKAKRTEQLREKFHNDTKNSERNSNDLTIPRSRSFQIVEQPSSGRKQRHKSELSLKTKTAITELVRPICVDLPPAKSDNPCGSYMFLKENGLKNTEPCKGVCSSKQDEENARSGAKSEGGVEPTASTHPFCTPASSSNNDVFVDEKSQVKDEEDSSDSTCHYVNLPEGSRPSCYLYMNLPDPRNAPKEAASYVNHVFMSRSMKGIYENVQQFYNEEFETAVSSEEGTSAPPLPPPALQPRQPPPRVPRRASKDRQAAQKSSERLPIHIRVPLGPPPPRPPKKSVSVTKEGLSNTQQDIQVQIAVFASKAVAGRVWFLRIVVMKHDPDDTAFKAVKEREIASKYHLMQTYPFSISSDIVVSLKHQCQQFKLTSEDYQEVEYNIIENLVHGFWFVIEFHLEHLGSDADQFVGNVCVEPKYLPAGEKCPVNKRVNLGITEDFNLKQNSGCEQHGNYYITGNQACKPVIPDYAKRKEICSKLDITMYSGNNWRDVAGKLGFDVQEIKSLDDKAQKCPNFSPMEHVLTKWEQRDPGCSLDRLVSILRDIERLDVVSDLGFPVDLES